jgi:two-component system response regulator AtoC
MSDASRKILVVDDEEKFLDSIAERLKILGYDPLKASSGPAALELVKKSPVDLAVVDYKMPGIDGLATIAKLKEMYPKLKSILLTGYGSDKVKQATDSINSAYFEKDRMQDFWDFIKKSSMNGKTIVIKPPRYGKSEKIKTKHPSEILDSGSIEIISGHGAEASGGESSKPVDAEDESSSAGKYRIIGETHDMQILRRNIARLAELDCTVIIRGETGTGKELTARAIHNQSPRKRNRFIAFNCGCFSSDLLIEELFRPGTKASAIDEGLASESGGTILLDQIEDMPTKMQLSMLKIIDNKEAYRNEDDSFFPFDMRILVASRFNLRKLVEKGKFREELFHRLNLMELFIPPLRERRDDIPPLCGYFLNKFSNDFNKSVTSISDEVISIFMAYEFPGNVRELEHVIERAVILADGDTIDVNQLPVRFKSTSPSTRVDEQDIITLAEMEKKHILKALRATSGNKSKAAELLGISRSALWRKLSLISAKK